MRNIPLVNIKSQYAQIKDEVEPKVLEVLRSGWYILGPNGEALEKELAEYEEAKYAVNVRSGTDALLLALKAVGVGPGDEVITSPFTFIATAEAIAYLGAKPVFVDIEPETYCLDVSKISAKISPKTKAIIPVHLYGHSVDVEAISEIAKKHNLKVIGDACQSIGLKYKGQGIGGIFDASCYSFFPTKNLGAAGEGGAVTTNDPEIADKVKYLRVHGMRERYKHEMIGYNARLDEIQCVILRIKLQRLSAWTKRRTEIAAKYNKAFQGLAVTIPQTKDYSSHVFHQYTLRKAGRDELLKFLQNQGIGTAVHYPIALHLQEAFSYLAEGPGSYPVAEQISREIFSLPVYPELSDEDVDYIIEKVTEGLK